MKLGLPQNSMARRSGQRGKDLQHRLPLRVSLTIILDTQSQNRYPGSSVTVFGTVAAKNPPQASLSFVVDNSITGTYTAPDDLPSDIHHEALWTSPTMNEGSHTIVITQIAAQTAGVIFLDYIMYNTSSSTVHPYFIDDRDPWIKYTAAWRKFGSDPDFQHTSQGSTFAGDSFSLPFEGKCQRLPVRSSSLTDLQGSQSHIMGELTMAGKKFRGISGFRENDE
jgi:hypothetical protein